MNKYYVDEAYDRGFVRPAFGLGLLCYAFDRYVIDSLVWLATAIPRGAGAAMRTFDHGSVQAYALTMICGIGAILVFMLVF